MTIVADDNTATPGGGHAEGVMERALAAAIRDPGRIGDLLDELSRGRLWLPLPDDGRPVTDGSAVNLPTLTYLGTSFVPAFTSAARLRGSVPRPRTPVLGVYVPAPVKPHVVVPAAVLARLLPADVGIALNPGAGESVPIYPEGVRYLASAGDPDPRRRITVGPPPMPPDDLLSGISSGLAGVPAVRDASAAWLSARHLGDLGRPEGRTGPGRRDRGDRARRPGRACRSGVPHRRNLPRRGRTGSRRRLDLIIG